MKFSFALLILVSFLMLRCEPKVKDDGETAQTSANNVEDSGVLIVAYDESFNPKLCWKSTEDRYFYFGDSGELSWSQKRSNDVSIKGRNIGGVEVNGDDLTWTLAAELLGVKLDDCVNGRYVEKSER